MKSSHLMNHKRKFRKISDPGIKEGYRVNQYGEVLGIRGQPLKVVLRKSHVNPVVVLKGVDDTARNPRNTNRTVHGLVLKYWGAGAAWMFRKYREELIYKQAQRERESNG